MFTSGIRLSTSESQNPNSSSKPNLKTIRSKLNYKSIQIKNLLK